MLNLKEIFESDAPLDGLPDLPAHVRRSLTWALDLRKMAPDHTLDLSADSADALDLIIDVALDGGFASPAHLIRAVAYYFEALLVHHLDAQYVDLGPFQVFLRLLLPGSSNSLVFTSPLRLAIDAWEKRRPRFAEAFEGLVLLKEDGVERPLFVPFYDPDDLDPVLEPVWLFARSLLVILGRFENDQWNLHMLPHNLRFVDEFMTREPDDPMQLRLVTVSEKPRELRWWQERACAAFFGEMVRAHLGGEWIGPQRGPVELRVRGGHTFSPLLLCRQALDGERGNYALLSAYQHLMDYHATDGASPFPLADLAVEPATHTGPSALQPLPALRDEAPRPSTRQYESNELERHLAEFPGQEPEPEEVNLSTRQYNSAELQRDLISQMRRQAGSAQAVEAELRQSSPAIRAYLTGEPAVPEHTVEDFEFDIDVDEPSVDTRNYDSSEMQENLLEMLDAEVKQERRVRQTLDFPAFDAPPRSGTMPAAPPRRGPGQRSPSRPHPKTVPRSPVDPNHPLHTVATVQGDIPPELLAHLTAADAGRDRAHRTEPLTQVAGRPRNARQPDDDASTVALSTSDPRLADLMASGQRPATRSRAPATAELDPITDPRLAALRAMSTPPDDEDASTRAVSLDSDPRMRALRDAVAAADDDEDEDDNDATEGGTDLDPRVASLARATPGSSSTMTARGGLGEQWPMSSGSISARTSRAPHGILAEVYTQFRPVLVPADWERLGEVVHRPMVERARMGSVPHIAIAIDYPDHLLYLNDDDLNAWHVTFDVVFQMACANLTESPENLTEFFVALELDDVKIYQLGIGDFYESSRVFLAAMVNTARQLLGSERLLVAVPNRNILVVASGESSVDEIARLRGVVQYCHTSQAHPLSDLVFLCDAQGRIVVVP